MASLNLWLFNHCILRHILIQKGCVNSIESGINFGWVCNTLLLEELTFKKHFLQAFFFHIVFHSAFLEFLIDIIFHRLWRFLRFFHRLLYVWYFFRAFILFLVNIQWVIFDTARYKGWQDHWLHLVDSLNGLRLAFRVFVHLLAHPLMYSLSLHLFHHDYLGA